MRSATSAKTVVSLLDRVRRVVSANLLQRTPLWYSVVQRYPPPVFHVVPRPKPAELRDEEVYDRFFQRYPDPRLQEALFTGRRNPRMVYLRKFVKHHEDLMAKGVAKEDAYTQAFAHYETLLRLRRELDRSALQEAYHFGAKLDFGTKDPDLEKEVQRVRRNKLVDVEKRIHELEQEWERLNAKAQRQ